MTSEVQVSEADVTNVKEDLERKGNNFTLMYDLLIMPLNRAVMTLRCINEELEILAKRYNIILDADLDKWSKEPKQLVSSYVGVCEVGLENDIVLALYRKKDYLKSLIHKENEKIKQGEETLLKIKETFHKIRFAKFSAKELDQELKNYDLIKAGIRAHISFCTMSAKIWRQNF